MDVDKRSIFEIVRDREVFMIYLTRKIVLVLLCVISIALFAQIVGCGEKPETVKEPTDSKGETKIVKQSSDCDWPMFGRTPEGNRIVPDGCGSKTDDLEFKWDFATPYIDNYSYNYIASGKYVYIDTNSNGIRCLDASDLSIKWIHKANSKINSSISFNEDKLYFETDDRHFYCLDSANGKILWKIEQWHKLYRYESDNMQSLLFEDDLLYLQTREGNIVYIDKNSGEILWYYYTFNRFYTNLKLVDNKIYFWELDFVCLNAKNGKIIWKFSYEKNIEESDVNLDCLRGDGGPGRSESDPVISNNKIYLKIYYTVFCLNMNTGKILWKHKTNYLPHIELAEKRVIVESGYCDNKDKYLWKLECLDKDSGKLIWDYILPGSINPREILPTSDFQKSSYKLFEISDKKILISCDLGNTNSMICLDVYSGKLLWDRLMPYDHANRYLKLGKRLYIGGDKLYCIDIGNGKTLWEKNFSDSKKYSLFGVSCPIKIQENKLLIQFWQKQSDISKSTQKSICIDLDGNKIWELDAELYLNAEDFCMPIITESYILFVNEWKLYYLNIDTGKVVWIKKPYVYNKTMPIISNGNVYIALNTIYCLDLDEGWTIWEYSENNEYFLYSPAISEGRLYCAADNDRMYCIDSGSGKKIWTYDTKGKITASPIVSDRKLYISTSGNKDKNTKGKIIVLDSITGAKIWEKQFENEINVSPVISNNNAIVKNGSNLICLDSMSGNMIWKYDASDAIAVGPTIFDGKVFFGTDKTIFCISLADGKTIFEHNTNAKLNSTILLYDNKIYFNTEDNFVHCLDFITREVVWEKKIVWMNPNAEKVANAIVNGRYFIVDMYNICSLDAVKGEIMLDHYKGYLNWDFDLDKGYPFDIKRFVPHMALSYGKMILVSPEGRIVCYGDKEAPKKEE